MQYKKIVWSLSLVIFYNSYGMNEESFTDQFSSPVTASGAGGGSLTGLRGFQVSKELVTQEAASGFPTTPFINFASSSRKQVIIPTKACPFPFACFAWNQFKRVYGLEVKPDTDPEIADAMRRISGPVRVLLTQFVDTTPSLVLDKDGNNIVAKGGSVPKESPTYQAFLAVGKETEYNAIIRNLNPSAEELHKLSVALDGVARPSRKSAYTVKFPSGDFCQPCQSKKIKITK